MAKDLGVDIGRGLSASVASERLAAFGPNRLQSMPVASVWRLLLRQFRGIIVALLFAASAISFYLKEWLEGSAVVAVLVINALMGFAIEWRATRSMEALRKLATVKVRVRRDGVVSRLPADDLVPGDMVLVEAGDILAADLRLVELAALEVDESSLTGESLPVRKSLDVLPAATGLADRTNLLYRGSRVTKGNGVGIVVATGVASELGRISKLVAEADRETTPLEKRLQQLGGRLVWLTLAIAAITVIAGILVGKEATVMLKTAIALAVAAIPEGLPVVATIALARGLWRMAERDALINRLSAVETLGATGVICTDKTGTLTENRLKVARLVVPESGEIELPIPNLEPKSERLLRLSILCNNAGGGAASDPLEEALLTAAGEAGMNIEETRRRFPRIREAPFEAERRLMA
ncbi:MAG: HAD-IC family P-type ATPase, partial [Verrucomicrobiae bacterium]|nr:HAD-IC family P-type ATPase [Verrucomicrobiae bacterium]